ncbi:ankyrin repeat domain-containing protein [Pseudofulvibacter geojedonensis]|uniref:Ankyrin repeat domain-containing protein n=1 Tax=Pseudofulvibacter geojedonensis TaxID=1123758 RepID=A0ABW3I122_9FLAO
MKKILLTALLAYGVCATANSNYQNNFTNPSVVAIAKSDVNALCKSIAANDIITVKKLLKLGEDVNSFSGGMTPLMYAARYNRVEIINMLVAKGAKLKARDSRGNTALVHAQRSGAKKAEMLLTKLISEKKKQKRNKKKRK